MKRPIRIESGTVLVDADSELICDTEAATPEELKALVDAYNSTALQDLINHLKVIKTESRMLVPGEQAEWLREHIQAGIDAAEAHRG